MIERKTYLDFLIKLKDKKIIKVITGIRRCGKSTLFLLYQDYLLKNGVAKEQIINYNFENPEDNKYENWKDLYNDIISKLNSKKMNYIFFDEIQILTNFEKLVDGLFTKNNVDIYITGSNSYMLSGELATYLTGRYMQIHMLPLSFKEYTKCINSKNELKDYIDSRIKLAHGNNGIINEQAIEAIYNGCNGSIRIANNIITKSLIMGKSKQVPTIDSNLILEAVNELSLG